MVMKRFTGFKGIVAVRAAAGSARLAGPDGRRRIRPGERWYNH